MVTVSTQENATYIEVAPSSSVIEVADVGVQGSSGIHIGPTPPTDTTRLWIQL